MFTIRWCINTPRARETKKSCSDEIYLWRDCLKFYTPGEYLTVDENLEVFPGVHFANIFWVNRKIWHKNVCFRGRKNISYANLHMYSDEQPNGKFLQSNKAFDVVDRLLPPISKSNTNITFDNWFTSSSLMLHLQRNHKLISTDTWTKIKKEIAPNSITYSTKFAFQKYVTFISYIPQLFNVVPVKSSVHFIIKECLIFINIVYTYLIPWYRKLVFA